MPTSHWHQHYCWPSGLSKYRMHSQNFHSQLIRPPFPRGSRLNKIHPRGNPTIVRSIPAVFPQHSYPHPRETRGFRGIPAVPIPVHTSIARLARVLAMALCLSVCLCLSQVGVLDVEAVRPVSALFSSVLQRSSRSDGWPHRRRTFSIYPCPKSASVWSGPVGPV